MKKILLLLISACLMVGMPSCKKAMKNVLNEIGHSTGMDGSKEIADAQSLVDIKEILLSKCDTEKMPVYAISIFESEECTGRALHTTVYLVNADKTQTYYQSFFFNGEVSKLNDNSADPTVSPIDLKALDMNMISKGIEDAKSQTPEGYTYKTVRNMLIKDGETRITMAVTKDGEETVTNAGQTSEVYYDAEYDIDNATGKATYKD